MIGRVWSVLPALFALEMIIRADFHLHFLSFFFVSFVNLEDNELASITRIQ